MLEKVKGENFFLFNKKNKILKQLKMSNFQVLKFTLDQILKTEQKVPIPSSLLIKFAIDF